MNTPDDAATHTTPSGARTMRRRVRVVGWVLVAILAVGLMIFEVILPSFASHELLAEGSAAPGIQLSDSAGKPHDVFADAGGKPIVVDFFDTSCDHCVSEVPSLCSEVARNPGVFFVAVETAGHSASDVASFVHSAGGGCLTIPVLVDPSRSAASSYHILDTPTTYVLAQGKVKAAALGENELAAMVKAATS